MERKKIPMTPLSGKDLKVIPTLDPISEKVLKSEQLEDVVSASVRKKLWYRKLGGGSLRFQGRIIKPNERFQACPEDIPEAFKDLLQCIDTPVIQKAAELPKHVYNVKEVIFELLEKEPGKWFVINAASKKALNEVPLTYESAIALQSAVNV